jgi:hypothetical protein
VCVGGTSSLRSEKGTEHQRFDQHAASPRCPVSDPVPPAWRTSLSATVVVVSIQCACPPARVGAASAAGREVREIARAVSRPAGKRDHAPSHHTTTQQPGEQGTASAGTTVSSRGAAGQGRRPHASMCKHVAALWTLAVPITGEADLLIRVGVGTSDACESTPRRRSLLICCAPERMTSWFVRRRLILLAFFFSRFLPQRFQISTFHPPSFLFTMCKRVECSKCSKPTWAGCGQHIEQALAGVPVADRCSCPRDGAAAACAPAAAAQPAK